MDKEAVLLQPQPTQPLAHMTSSLRSENNQPAFNLKEVTAQLKKSRSAADLFSLSRCEQLSVLIQMLLDGASEEDVQAFNEACLAEGRKAASE
jgi:hypothetical protein